MAGVDKRTLGAAAERVAAHHLEGHGLTILDRNYRCRLGEIDIVAADDDCLAFIEVRYRGPGSYSSAGATVDRRKQARLIRAAALYLAHNEHGSSPVVRFDVVAIDADADGNRAIEWIRDAFRPGDARL